MCDATASLWIIMLPGIYVREKCQRLIWSLNHLCLLLLLYLSFFFLEPMFSTSPLESGSPSCIFSIHSSYRYGNMWHRKIQFQTNQLLRQPAVASWLKYKELQ